MNRFKKIILCGILVGILVGILLLCNHHYIIVKDDNKNLYWYEKYHVIAHALGEIDGHTYTNSLEAFEKSYKNGIRIYDADLNITLDKKYVLRHEWVDNIGVEYSTGLNPTYAEFMSKKIYSNYTPLSLEDFLKIMDKYSDIYVAFDAKDDIVKMYSDLVNIIISKHLEHLLDRVIVSFYKYEDYYKIKKIYPFKNYAIRYYENDPKNVDELISFCKTNDINVVNIKMLYINKNNDWKKIVDNGLKVYAAVVNDDSIYKNISINGVWGIVSDSIPEKSYN